MFFQLFTLLLWICTGASANPASTPSYEADIRPIFDTKCVSCHACYDAPCQLNLTHPEGLQRGATKAAVYGEMRLKEAPMTRLFEDATSAEGWRDKGFFPVVGEDAASSLLWSAVSQGAKHALPADEPPPPAIDLSLGAKQQCPMREEYEAFSSESPLYGMPYGMAALTSDELDTIRRWLNAGAPIDTPAVSADQAEAAEIQRWEAFLNQADPRAQLVARYLYEHLFLAKLSFAEADSAHDFRLVRTSSPPGSPIVPLPTRRPNQSPLDDPAALFYYRFELVRGTRVRKSHLPLVLSADYLDFLDELFLSGTWTTAPGSAHNWDRATNPFVAFADIPQDARYRFLLEDAWFFISNFIRGPVCRGPIALNVIQDHFFVGFIDPESDLDPDFVDGARELLDLPGSPTNLQHYVRQTQRLARNQRKYLKRKDRELADQIPLGRETSELWTGHPEAQLTVFRHRDSSTVVRDWVGQEPETVWVMDFTTLERTYYALVANFDVFGSVFHLTSTRLYFDFIRAESEDNFLLFMPEEARKALRASWYRGLVVKRKQLRQYRFAGRDLPGANALSAEDPKADWLHQVRNFGPISAPEQATPLQRQVVQRLRALEEQPQPVAQYLPEMTVVHVVVDGSLTGDRVYSITRDRAHTNISFMLRERARLRPKEDGLTATAEVLGDYPNRIFRVPEAQVQAFFDQLAAVRSDEDYRALVRAFGLYRTDPALFDELDWLYQRDRQLHPVTAGRLDLYRYGGELPTDAGWFKWPEGLPLLGAQKRSSRGE